MIRIGPIYLLTFRLVDLHVTGQLEHAVHWLLHGQVLELNFAHVFQL
jgi:hypothetical protein